MNIEETVPNKKKIFFIITLGALVALLILSGVTVFITVWKNAKQADMQISDTTQGLTDEEKLLKSQNEELDRLRAQYQAQDTSSEATIKDQTQSLDTLRTKRKITTSFSKKTLEQQDQELDALRAVSN